MDYILNVITFLLLFPNGEIKALPYHFDPNSHNCDTFYLSKVTYVEDGNYHLFNDFKFKVRSIGFICSDTPVEEN